VRTLAATGRARRLGIGPRRGLGGSSLGNDAAGDNDRADGSLAAGRRSSAPPSSGSAVTSAAFAGCTLAAEKRYRLNRPGRPRRREHPGDSDGTRLYVADARANRIFIAGDSLFIGDSGYNRLLVRPAP
jgi:hypothetical protein